jgi:hypothetical protein
MVATCSDCSPVVVVWCGRALGCSCRSCSPSAPSILGKRGSVLLSGSLPPIRAYGYTLCFVNIFHRIFGSFLLWQFMSRLVGGVVGGGGVRGWRLDEAMMLNPSLATCLDVRVCSE